MDLSRFFPPSILDQSFGLCISPEDLIFPSYNFHRTSYYRPWKWYMQSAEKDFGSTIQNEKERFKIALDVQHFQPEEINVKVSERDVIIEGQHKERQDNHGLISRQFKRRYFLPHDCDIDTVFSSLSSDGVLTITANKVSDVKEREIVVPIKMCNSCQNKDVKAKIEAKEQTTSIEDKKKPDIEKARKEEKYKIAKDLKDTNTGETKMEANKQIVGDLKKTDRETSQKGMEIMLKEDHCCLLKPELLGAPSGTGKVQTTKVLDDMLKTSMETCAQQAASIIRSEKIDAVNEKLMAEKSEACEITSTEMSETITSGLTAAGRTAVACAGITDKITSGISSSEITEASEITSAEKMEKAETLFCGSSSEGKTTEGAGSFLNGLSSIGKSERNEAVSCGITSEVLTEKTETSTSAKTDMSNITSMLNKTIQIQESSTSYSSSMAASIKETTEKISEIVSDISAQLKEAAENI